MSTRPGEGERWTASGYRSQYLIGAVEILRALASGDMDWVRVADPEVGRVDDLQIGTTARVDAYQVKWAQYGGAVTLNDLLSGTDKKPSLIAQLADGWRRLQTLHPQRRVVVHFVTNAYPSSSESALMPQAASPPSPYHLAAFIEQAWHPTHRTGRLDSGDWVAVWESIRTASGLSPNEFETFVLDCSLDFRTVLPEINVDIRAIADLLFSTAAGAERRVELRREELLQQLGWTSRYTYHNVHEFPAPLFLYRPIQSTVEAVQSALTLVSSGYVSVFGSPGSGKSTLLTRTLRALPLRLVRYYAYVPESQDPSVLRGESINFLHDVTLRLHEAGICRTNRTDSSDRSAMLNLFHEQLQSLGDDYQKNKTKTVILIDGLDHIEREQHPERSLLRDLPLPEAIPVGVYIVLGSQTDELSDLPPRVHHTLKQQERRIEMGHLSPADVYAVAEQAAPVLSTDERQRVFELANGHPLALIYLLKQLCQAEQPEERTQLLEEAISYKGDIEAQYWGHWQAIENDEGLVHTLGLLARMRGSIPMKWVAQWAKKPILRKLQCLLLTYFQKEGEDCWVFFHNSFRLFLIERTAEPLPGQTLDQQNQAYHRELAERYETSLVPWRWEALYHLYSAREYTTTVAMAKAEWFREQVEALRPLDAVQTVRLALKAAGMCRDIVALATLTLVGAALEQCALTLKDSALPELLLEAGEFVQAIEYLRDGNRLRVDAEQALRLSVYLSEVGWENEGRRVFELAEPLELLSGRLIPNDNARPQNLGDLLSAWVQSALVFRGPKEVMQVVRRILIEPEVATEEGTPEQASWRLQSWLLFQGTLACCDRGDWASWRILFGALDEERNRQTRFYTLLRSAKSAQGAGETSCANSLLQELLATFHPNEFSITDEQYAQVDARLAVAELTLKALDDVAVARTWAGVLPPIPIQDRRIHHEQKLSLYELQFRRARLCYFFGETREPEALRDEAEAYTEFGQYVEDGERIVYRQIALAVFCLARLWAWGRLNIRLEPVMFLWEVRWILNLLGPGWIMWPMSYRVDIWGARSDVLREMVAAATQHGEEVVAALMYDFETRWTDSEDGSAWPINLQRELVIMLAEVGANHIWVKAQLRRIEPLMLQDLDPNGRVEECKAQAEAWLSLSEREAALVQLRRMIQAARGILSEKDYQLSIWVEWLGRINELEPDQAEERSRLMLRRILSVQESGSGVVDALEELLEVMFRRSPRRAVRLLQGLLELYIVDHQGGVACLLKGALNAEKPPVVEVLHTVVDLILPFVTGTEPELVESLIIQIAERFGQSIALDIARYLVDRIGSDAPSTTRPAWYRGVASGLRTIGYTSSQVGLQPTELEDRQRSSSSDLDRNLYLKDGQRLQPDEVLAQVQTLGDFCKLLRDEEREHSRYFNWAAVASHLISQLFSVADLRELENVIRSRLAREWSREAELSRVYTSLSKRFLELGDRASAWIFAEQALKTTQASGWDPYFDGGARLAALQQLITIDAGQGRELAIDLYAQDLSERFRYPGRIIFHLDEVLMLLSGDVPVVKVWPAIEIYLDELFASVPTEPQLSLEALLEVQPDKDTPDRAMADLLSLYLDHPSYSVAQGAVRACTAVLLNGSQAIIAALVEALVRTDQAAERALMVLDAVSMEEPALVLPFVEALELLRSSPNFTIRLIASIVYARIRDEQPTLLLV